MNQGIFIQANRKQLLGAKVAKHALESQGGANKAGIPVTIMLVENMPVFTKFAGMKYQRGSEIRAHDENDLQFFTLSRFMPPRLMQYNGRALVIDPDIFALSDITELFSMSLQGNTIAACKKNDAWDSSVMVLDCEKLTGWNIENLLEGLRDGKENYRDWMELRLESHVLELPRIWNSLDALSSETKLLHTTIPREPLLKLRGKWPTQYQKHPNPEIETLFFKLAQAAYHDGAVSESEIRAALGKDIRVDFLEMLNSL